MIDSSNILNGIIAGLLISALQWIASLTNKKLRISNPLRLQLVYVPIFIGILSIIVILILSFYLPFFTTIRVLTFIIITIGISFLFIYNLLRKFNKVGIVGADIETGKGLNYSNALNLCHKTFSFLGTGAAKLTIQKEFESAMQRCRHDKPIRILLRVPEDSRLEEASKLAGREPDEYKRIIKSSLKIIAKLRKDRSYNIEVRFYTDYPIFRLMFIDDGICLVSYNVFGKGDGSQLPQIHIKRAKSEIIDEKSFYYAFENYFELKWKNSEIWDFEKYV